MPGTRATKMRQHTPKAIVFGARPLLILFECIVIGIHHARPMPSVQRPTITVHIIIKIYATVNNPSFSAHLWYGAPGSMFWDGA